jgi:hypothetical protein
MNKSLKFLLLTTAVLGSGVIFASSSPSEGELVVQQPNHSGAMVPFSLASLVPQTTAFTTEEARQLALGIRSKNLAVDSRMALVQQGLSSLQLAPNLVDRANMAIRGYVEVLNTVDELSAAAAQMTTALFAHLNCDQDKISRCLRVILSKTEGLQEKEASIRGVMALLQASEVQGLVTRLEETKTSIVLVSEAFARASQSPARGSRAQSEAQHHDELSPTQNHNGSSPVVSLGSNEGGAHEADDLYEDDGEGNKKQLGLPNDTESDRD